MSELIAFIGIGNMGSPMAENLVKAGKNVKVFDTSLSMLEKAKEKKMEVAKNLDELITNEVTTVITMLPEGKNSEEKNQLLFFLFFPLLLLLLARSLHFQFTLLSLSLSLYYIYKH